MIARSKLFFSLIAVTTASGCQLNIYASAGQFAMVFPNRDLHGAVRGKFEERTPFAFSSLYSSLRFTAARFGAKKSDGWFWF
jgi:hypothetical protein